MAGIRAGIKDVVREVDHGWERIRKSLEVLRRAGSTVKVGVLGNTASASHGGINNVDLAAVHEFGSTSRGIPERSFLRAPYDENRDRYYEMLGVGLRNVIEGKLTVEKVLGIVGLKMESDFKARIVAGIPPPLKPETIARKGSSTPLIDHGQLLGAISHEVVLKGR